MCGCVDHRPDRHSRQSKPPDPHPSWLSIPACEPTSCPPRPVAIGNMSHYAAQNSAGVKLGRGGKGAKVSPISTVARALKPDANASHDACFAVNAFVLEHAIDE